MGKLIDIITFALKCFCMTAWDEQPVLVASDMDISFRSRHQMIWKLKLYTRLPVNKHVNI